MDPNNILAAIGGTGGLALLAYWGQFLIRKLQRASLEGVKDRQEVNVMEVNEKEIERLRAEGAALRAELLKAYQDQRELGRLTAVVDQQKELLSQLSHRIDASGKSAATERKELRTMMQANTELTQETKDAAREAYKEANTVNNKIESIGLQMRDQKPLEETPK